MQVGERIRATRLGLGLSVGALAERTGLSKGVISQIENEKTSPSLATLEKLAEGLEVPVAYLVLKQEERIQVVRRAERSLYQFGPNKIRVEMLTGPGQRVLKAVLVELPPGASTGDEAHAHAGEEFHLVLEGRVEAQQAGESVVLEAGDTFHWKGCTPHRVINVGEGTAKVLAVSTTTMMQMIGENG